MRTSVPAKLYLFLILLLFPVSEDNSYCDPLVEQYQVGFCETRVREKGFLQTTRDSVELIYTINSENNVACNEVSRDGTLVVHRSEDNILQYCFSD